MNSFEIKLLIINIFAFTLPIIMVFGSIGNLFSFIIFSRNKFRKTFFSVYFRVLAITDTFTLLYALNEFSSIYFNLDIQNVSNLMCKMSYYFIYCISPVSAWLLVVVSLDRMFSIIRPNKFLFMKKLKIQITIVFFVFLFNLAYYIPYPIIKEYQEINDGNSSNGSFVCAGTKQEDVEIVNLMDIFNSTIIPFIFMIIFTLVTVKRLIESRLRSKSKIETNNLEKESSSKLKPRDIKFALTSIILNVLFFILNLPVCVAHIIMSRIALDDIDLKLFYTIIIPTFFLNFGVVFYVNFFTNPFFRKELFILLNFKKDSIPNFATGSSLVG